MYLFMQICKDEQHLLQHHLHLTDGNDERYFIAVHTQSNDGAQQTLINVA